jgi:flagellar basal-body rod protein FlgB
MESQGLFKGTLPLLEKALDLRAFQHKLTAANIANMDTPHYRGFDMLLEEQLGRLESPGADLAMVRTDPAHLGGAAGGALGAPGGGLASATAIVRRQDDNGIDIDQEMARMSANQMLFDTLLRVIGRRFQGLKNVIQGGR